MALTCWTLSSPLTCQSSRSLRTSWSLCADPKTLPKEQPCHWRIPLHKEPVDQSAFGSLSHLTLELRSLTSFLWRPVAHCSLPVPDLHTACSYIVLSHQYLCRITDYCSWSLSIYSGKTKSCFSQHVTHISYCSHPQRFHCQHSPAAKTTWLIFKINKDVNTDCSRETNSSSWRDLTLKCPLADKHRIWMMCSRQHVTNAG